MPEHKLRPGKNVIEGLCALGRALGYVARAEHPVADTSRPPAVDVAWLRDDEARYPLMIFEVETSASNAMSNNATKVFGQPARSFERPLFFFHIILKSGKDTSRTDALLGAFGSHNYRVYEIGKSTGTSLVNDILEQHRRLSRRISIEPVLRALLQTKHLPVDLATLVDHAISLGLVGDYMRSLARLACIPEAASDFRSLFAEALLRVHTKADVDTGYDSYLGINWATPIHISLMRALELASDLDTADRLRAWQNSWYISQIGPHFGLAQDYDEFLLSLAAPLIALLACLCLDSASALNFLADECSKLAAGVAEKVDPIASLFSAVWSVHVAAATGSAKRFSTAVERIERLGGVSEMSLLRPNGLQDIESLASRSHERLYEFSMIDAFREDVQRAADLGVPTCDAVELALQALTSDDTPTWWGGCMAKILAAQQGFAADEYLPPSSVGPRSRNPRR